jgi:thiamine phosphate synthase YjbQ (UPF0047 family)
LGWGRFPFGRGFGAPGTGPLFSSLAVFQDSFTVGTRGQGTAEMADDVARIVARSGVARGVAHGFCQHTSRSLMLMENADPTAPGDRRADSTEAEPWRTLAAPSG